MAFAGLCGLNVNFENIDLLSEDHGNVLNILFAEECGWILECSEDNFEYVNYAFQQRAISCSIIGHTGLYGIDSEVRMKPFYFIKQKKNIFNMTTYKIRALEWEYFSDRSS